MGKKKKRTKEALKYACRLLASRGIPFEEVTYSGYTARVEYLTAEKWEKYFYKLAERKNKDDDQE